MKRRDALKLMFGGVGGLCTGSFATGAEQGDLPRLTGWIDDASIRAKFIRRHQRPFLSQYADQIKGTGAGKRAFLWKLFERVTGWPLIPHTQTVGDCFIAGTMVTMSDGSQRAIETVEVGESVLSHRGIPRKVTRTIRKPYQKSLVKFQAHGCLEKITCTPDHLILVNDSEWKAAGALKLTDQLHLPRYVPNQGNKVYDLLDVCPDAETKGRKLRAKGSPRWVNRYIRLDKKLAVVVGAYLAEGGCSKSEAGQRYRVDFNLNHQEDDFAEHIAKNMRQIFGVACTVTSIPSKPTVQYVRCGNTAVARFFKYLIPGNTYTKKVPLDFLTAPVKVQLTCLLNWLEGDGSCHGRKNCKLRAHRRPRCSGVSVSRDLINGVFQLAANCNLIPKIRKSKAQADRAQAYVIQFNTIDTSRLYFKAGRVGKATLFTAPLKKISRISKAATTVYCLEVAEDHSFIANGYVVHNCIGHSFGLGIDVLTAVRMQMYHMPERWVAKTATEIIYAGARIETGGMSRRGLMGDGVTGTLAADFCRDYGILLRQPYLGGQYDFTKYSGAKARAMGRRGKGVPNELEPLCKLHPLKTCSLVRSWEECRDAVANGYPVVMCSNLGFWTKRDKDGFLRRRRRPWYHAMVILGIDDEYRRPGALVVNSWGCSWVSGPTRHNQPAGSFWCDAATVDAAMAQGDSIALSGYVGYPQLDLPEYILW